MRNFLKRNQTYFACLGMFLLAGGIYLALYPKGEAIIFFSDRRTLAGDIFFKTTTLLGEAYLYVVLALAMLAVRFRYTLLIALTGVTVMLVSFGLKSFFRENRPFAFFREAGLLERIRLVDGVEVHSGATSLPSGHTMSAFALYGLLVFLLPNRKRYALPLFLLALLVGFSRIYLVQHFAVDVYWGAITGTLVAMIVYALHLHFETGPDHWLEKPLFRVGKLTGRQVKY